MGYRIQGLSNAFVRNSAATADREIGELVRVTESGEAAYASGEGDKLFFPLIQPIRSGDKVAEAQITGIAKIKVEDSTNIVAGVPVGPGATLQGVQQAQDGEAIIGMALETPDGNNDHIAVLLTPQAIASAIY